MINVRANKFGVGYVFTVHSSVVDRHGLIEVHSDPSTFCYRSVTDSFKQQTNRILVAEAFLQAATRQASDP